MRERTTEAASALVDVGAEAAVGRGWGASLSLSFSSPLASMEEWAWMEEEGGKG